MMSLLKNRQSPASLHRVIGAAAAASATVMFVSVIAAGIGQLA